MAEYLYKNETEEQKSDRRELQKIYDPTRGNCQDDQEVIFTSGYNPDRVITEEKIATGTGEAYKRDFRDNLLMHPIRTLGGIIVIGGLAALALWGVRGGCKAEQERIKKETEHIQENYPREPYKSIKERGEKPRKGGK